MAVLSFKERAALTKSKAAERLLVLMENKQTNLCISADVTSSQDLIALADELGPEICMLKTHIDLLEDFDWTIILRLQELAQKHAFLLFEDRKFADIGQTVWQQYNRGMYRMVEWADFVTVHAISGPGIVQTLAEPALAHDHGLLLIGQMSTANNLYNEDLTQQVLEISAKHQDAVAGLIVQQGPKEHPGMIFMTPGVHLEAQGDHHDQQYRNPREAIMIDNCDLIIVGRGISQEPRRLIKAQAYRKAAWEAYIEKVS